MKLHIKTVLPIIVTLLLLFFLSGCLPGLLTPPPPKGVISGRVMVPSSEAAKDITGWVPAANATVTLTDSEGVTHTVTTDEDGYYTFTNVAVNADTIITATATIDGNTLVMKDVVPQAVVAIEDYDAGTMTPESTALGLIVEELIEQGLTSEDINLQEIQASDNFTAVVEQVSSVLEENGNVTTDPDVTAVVNDTAEEIINPPDPDPEPEPEPEPTPESEPTPEPEPEPTPPTTVPVSAISINQEDQALTVGATLELKLTFDPANATNKNVDWTTSDESIATVVNGVITAVDVGEATITVTTADGGKTDTIEIIVIPPVFNGPVTGQITADAQGNVDGTLDLDCETLTIVGEVTGTGNITTFTGTVSGVISGNVTASINAMGIDTLYGIITNTGAAETVRIIGTFPQTGIGGDFEGQIITGDELTPVTSMTIKGEGDVSTVVVGSALQMIAEIEPSDASDEVIWSVYVNNRDIAEIDEDTGVLTGLQPGSVIVIAKTLDDSSLADATTAVYAVTVVGDSYQGGIVAYILVDGDPGYDASVQHGLIAATADTPLGSGIIWAIPTYQDTAVTGTLLTLGTGSANTDKIIAQNGAGSNYAAGLARAYNGGGYSDWFLPSKDELDKLFLNRILIGSFVLNAGTYYWSSSEYDANANYAWAQGFAFASGNQTTTDKSSTYTRVRAVRVF